MTRWLSRSDTGMSRSRNSDIPDWKIYKTKFASLLQPLLSKQTADLQFESVQTNTELPTLRPAIYDVTEYRESRWFFSSSSISIKCVLPIQSKVQFSWSLVYWWNDLLNFLPMMVNQPWCRWKLEKKKDWQVKKKKSATELCPSNWTAVNTAIWTQHRKLHK